MAASTEQGRPESMDWQHQQGCEPRQRSEQHWLRQTHRPLPQPSPTGRLHISHSSQNAAEENRKDADHPTSNSSRPTRMFIPPAATVARAEPWSQMAEANALNEDAASIVGVSIGREQARMNLPSTPAAEKSAALDRANSWGFFDSAFDDHAQLAGIEEDGREVEARAGAEPFLDDMPLPSPWVSGPRVHETIKDRNRSRTSSLFSATLPDLNVKQILQNLNPSSLTDALHKLSPLTGTKEGSGIEKRSSRSNSLFAHRMTWSGLGRKDGSASPGRRNTSGHASVGNTPKSRHNNFDNRTGSGESTPKSNSPERLQTAHGLGISATPPAASETPSEPRSPVYASINAPSGSEKPARPGLRRAASDGSMLSRTSTKYSFDADKDQFSNIDSMVNSRFKAVKDSWQDSAFRFKNVTNSTKRISLMPDFLKSTEEVGPLIPRSLTGFFGEGGSNSETKQSPNAPSSPKLSRHPSLDKALDDLTGDLVIMGGYRGSILRSAEPPHRQLWVPIKVGLNVRRVNLEMGLEPEDEETEHERIFASGILSHIGPIDISRRLLRRVKSSRNCRNGTLRLHDYGYDWRLSPELLGRRLIKYLEDLPCNQSDVHPSRRGATIIAHSLGGLITRWAVNQRPELFAGVLFAGTPQHCVNILGPFRNGDDVLLSSRVLTAQVNFTLRTSYALLPETGRCFIDKDTNEEYRVDFFDPKQWEEYRWSPCLGGYPLPANAASSGEVTRMSRSGSILATLRESVPSLPSLASKSTGNLPGDGVSSGTGSISPHPLEPSGSSTDAVTEAGTSSVAASASDAAATLERKADTLAHPNETTFEPSMNSPPPVPPSASVATAVSIPVDRARTYLTRVLADTQRFKRALSHRVEHEEVNAYPPFSVLYSTCVPTVYGAKVAGREGIKQTDAYDNLVFAAGDGVVLARASMLPRGYSVCEGGRIMTDRGHVGLLGDLESVGSCLLALGSARGKGTGLGKDVAVNQRASG